jgi:DNA-binding response OmpR family regulator
MRVREPARSGKHVLVVDDDKVLREMVAKYLRGASFRVTAVPDGAAMADALQKDAPDLLILDLRLEREDGLDLMRRLGDRPDLPIIVVTGHKRDETDRVIGLELGADDYLTKPFGLRELLARVRAVLRRAEAAKARPQVRDKRTRYRFAGFELNMRLRRLTSPTGEAVQLTAGEFNLLTAFLQSPEQVLSREQLLAASRLHDEEVVDRSIDVQILRLRRRLEADPSKPQLIQTRRGAGYVLAVPVEVF